jgi:hypothetical protein
MLYKRETQRGGSAHGASFAQCAGNTHSVGPPGGLLRFWGWNKGLRTPEQLEPTLAEVTQITIQHPRGSASHFPTSGMVPSLHVPTLVM